MSSQLLSKNVPSLRRAVASPAQALRNSSSIFLQGHHVLSLAFFSTARKALDMPVKWIAAASYKQKLATSNPKAKQQPNPNNPWKAGKAGQGNVPMVPLKRRSANDSKSQHGAPFLLSKFSHASNPSGYSRLQANWTALKLSRALHSAVGDNDESDDFDDFHIEQEAPKSKIRSFASPVAKRPRSTSSKLFESDEDDDVPIVTTKGKKASAIAACEDSEEEEEDESELFIKKRSASTAKVKHQRSVNGRKPVESRDLPTKKSPVGLQDLVESKTIEAQNKLEAQSKSDVLHELDLSNRGPLNQESMPDSDDTKASKNVPEDTGSNSSHLTNTRFDKFPISPLSIKALHSVLKYERMTEVQEATFPVILNGQDVLAKARTGTGKTIAFLLPAIEAILKAPEGRSSNPIHVVIVCPTRELAQQAAAEAQTLLQFHRGLGAQVVYGGNSIRGEQMNLSRKPCQILVGTPGRLVDHIQRTPELSRQLKSVKLFVLDEADHMLDMGFRDSLLKIMQALPSKRQTLLFSATIPKEVHNISRVALKNDHVFIDAVGKDSQDTHAKVKQQYIVVPLQKQLRVLYAALKQHMEADPQYKVLVFCTTARTTGFFCKLFTNLGFNSREIHSRKDQSYRTRVSDEFRNSKGGIILFTSDVSARGVDYPNVTLVIQVGAPSEFEQYIHRLGRTGRAGKKGEGLLILAPWEDYFLQKLAKLPITQMAAPKLSSSAKEKILNSAGTVDEGIKEMAYTAWLGYYRSLKGLTLDKVMLVEYANQFSASMGYSEPPALSRMVVSKMALTGVPGIRLRR